MVGGVDNGGVSKLYPVRAFIEAIAPLSVRSERRYPSGRSKDGYRRRIKTQGANHCFDLSPVSDPSASALHAQGERKQEP